ncbi:MAG TPA: hypothetical protein VN923_15635, partial [Thermoanaerobaculia bacterium]|nr:hypothetical protein [Thermoanaerobaculia bacterium]
MIAFATLWLGLVSGTVPVELLAGAEVARIELRLDDVPCAAIAAPPWKADCELGPELAPHVLEASAFDVRGRPLGHVQQWLNLPRDPAELEVALDREPGSPPRLLARLAWAGPAGASPTAVRATLDGEPLALQPGATTIELPPAAPGAAKLLRVEAEFPGGAVASREIAVGGDLAAQIALELTGLPVEPLGRSDGATLSDGARELPVVALEKGDADLVAVIDPSALPALAKLAREGNKQRVSRGGIGIGAGATPGTRTLNSDARAKVPIPDGARLRLVWPVAESRLQGQLRYDLFATSPERTSADGSLLDQLERAAMMPASPAQPRLADAVALAALTAAQPGRRRAVVLVLGGEPVDASLYDASRVRRFLDRLRVPLLVWSVAPPAPSVTAAWGDAETVSSVQRLEGAARRLDALVQRQRIAWVEGTHLPQRLVPGPGAALRLASAEPRAATDEGDAASAIAAALRQSRGAADVASESNAELDVDTAGGDVSTAAAPDADVEPSAASAVEVAEAADDAAAAAERSPAPASESAAVPEVPTGLARRPLPPFSLASDVGDERLIVRLGAVAAALPADFGDRFGLRAPPAGTLILFARSAEFHRWLEEQGGGDAAIEGFARNGVAALAVEHLHGDEVAALMVHELGHLLGRAAMGRQLPPWLEEGLAEEL